MARDRLPDLIENSSSSSRGNLSQHSNSSDTVLNMSYDSNSPNTGCSAIDTVLTEYTDVRVKLAQISRNLDRMNKLLLRTSIRQFNEEEMDDLRVANLSLGNELTIKFKELRGKLAEENDYSLEARMKRTLFYGLHQSFIHVWNNNEKFLQTYEDRLKKNLVMYSKIVNMNATEEEVEELINSKQTNIFVGNILEQTEKERQNLRELIDRCSELKRLEKSLEEVHALFIRIQNLVFEQSEQIQVIEYHAQQASLQVDKGNDQLDKANTLSKSVRKKKICLIALGVSVVFILLIFLFA
ncbi:Syx4 family protein [Megaselia abdita]